MQSLRQKRVIGQGEQTVTLIIHIYIKLADERLNRTLSNMLLVFFREVLS